MKDNILPIEKNDFIYIYAENPYENTEHAIPEQLMKNTREAQNENDDMI